MDIRQHAIALVSVIIGLGLTDLLGNLNRLIRARRATRWHALPLLWALIVLLFVSNYWWGLYQGNVLITTASNAVVFLLGLGLPILLYLLCAAILPDAQTPQSLDLRTAYLAESRYFFALFVTYVALTAVQSVVANGAFLWSEVMVFRCVVIACSLPLLWTRTLWHHWLATGVVLTCTLYLLAEIAWH